MNFVVARVTVEFSDPPAVKPITAGLREIDGPLVDTGVTVEERDAAPVKPVLVKTTRFVPVAPATMFTCT